MHFLARTTRTTEPLPATGKPSSRCVPACAVVTRPKADAGASQCRVFAQRETKMHFIVAEEDLFSRGECVAFVMSGGKDSIVYASLVGKLSRRQDGGLVLILLVFEAGLRACHVAGPATAAYVEVSMVSLYVVVS